jgi:hypothetical protein
MLEALCQKYILCVFQNVKWNERKYTFDIIQNVPQKRNIILLEMYHSSMFSPSINVFLLNMHYKNVLRE